MAGPVRKSPRMSFFDYSSSQYYFVTICTHEKKCIFGSIKNLSRYGQIAADSIAQISTHYFGVTVDKFVVMPNHIHVLLTIDNINPNFSGGHGDPPLQDVIRNLKSYTTKKYWEICDDKNGVL